MFPTTGVRRERASKRSRSRETPARRLDLRVGEEELARRRAAWRPPELPYPRGWTALYARHVTQADKGCDFDFLEGTAPLPEPEIH